MYLAKQAKAEKILKILNLHKLRFPGSYKSKLYHLAGRALPLSGQNSFSNYNQEMPNSTFQNLMLCFGERIKIHAAVGRHVQSY